MLPIARTNQASPPQLIIAQEFSDMENLARVVGWDQKFRQLEPGDLHAKVSVLGNDSCVAFRIRLDRSFHQIGRPPEGYWTIGIPDPEVESMRIWGQDIRPAPIFNFSSDVALDSVTHGGFGGTIFSFPPELLKSLASTMPIGADLESKIREVAYWKFSESDATYLRGLIDEVFDYENQQDQSDYLREHQEAFDFEFAAAMLQLISSSESLSHDTVTSRQQVLDRALEALENYDSRNMSVAELCEASFASLSTLNRAFMDEFGISPKVYMRAQRLAGVQKALINASPGDRITDIGNDWGFWHMGMFASDYKKQFAELPSETLQRAWAQNSK